MDYTQDSRATALTQLLHLTMGGGQLGGEERRELRVRVRIEVEEEMEKKKESRGLRSCLSG